MQNLPILSKASAIYTIYFYILLYLFLLFFSFHYMPKILFYFNLLKLTIKKIIKSTFIYKINK